MAAKRHKKHKKNSRACNFNGLKWIKIKILIFYKFIKSDICKGNRHCEWNLADSPENGWQFLVKIWIISIPWWDVFHTDCLADWFSVRRRKQYFCPCCRQMFCTKRWRDPGDIPPLNNLRDWDWPWEWHFQALQACLYDPRDRRLDWLELLCS